MLKFSLMLFSPILFAGCAVNNDLPKPDIVPAEKGKRSSGVSQDLKLMWSVQPKVAGRNWVASTEQAIDASERVFNTVDLKGQSREQIAKTLRFDLRAKNFGYYAPFWPVERGVCPVRIDNGSYGWQFDIHFDDQGHVKKVTRRWIH